MDRKRAGQQMASVERTMHIHLQHGSQGIGGQFEVQETSGTGANLASRHWKVVHVDDRNGMRVVRCRQSLKNGKFWMQLSFTFGGAPANGHDSRGINLTRSGHH